MNGKPRHYHLHWKLVLVSVWTTSAILFIAYLMLINWWTLIQLSKVFKQKYLPDFPMQSFRAYAIYGRLHVLLLSRPLVRGMMIVQISCNCLTHSVIKNYEWQPFLEGYKGLGISFLFFCIYFNHLWPITSKGTLMLRGPIMRYICKIWWEYNKNNSKKCWSLYKILQNICLIFTNRYHFKA